MNRLIKNLKKNKKGSIEGLPLQLMIVIVVATMGTAILMGWMGNIDTPTSIGSVEVLSDEIQVQGGYVTDNVVIYVTDQDGNPLEGATVVLTGYGITSMSGGTAYATTGTDGMATFDDLKLTLNAKSVVHLGVEVSKSGYGSDNTASIVVIP